MKGVMQMVFHKLVTAKIRLFFGSLRARKAKRRLLREFKKNPQSVSALSRAYERFLRAIRKEQEYTVALKAVRADFSRRPILPLTLDTGNYTVSRKAKEILSETDRLERAEHVTPFSSKIPIRLVSSLTIRRYCRAPRLRLNQNF